MTLPCRFIRATTAYTTREAAVPAPYFRRRFTVEGAAAAAELTLCGLGFYELYLNGERLTRGALSPYISSPDDVVCYDTYDLAGRLTAGENVLGLCLGNGMQNSAGGMVWEFEKARWRGAPQLALRLTWTDAGGEHGFESDETFRTAASPILCDDLRWGEVYDARRELPGWAAAGYDDSDWQSALPAPMPRGELVRCDVDPILVEEERAPVAVTPLDDGYLYDFGINTAGVCRLCIEGEPGQTLTLLYGEHLVDGRLDMSNISFAQDPDRERYQRDVYICAGRGMEMHVPAFTYHGFRYVMVTGVTAAQATPGLLTCLVMHTALAERGGFTCSDETVNTLQAITRRSTLTNFVHFPTDCPQREKNGWTADAALSCEHVLLNLAAERNYREWMRHIRAAQRQDGALPGIIPTGGWGFEWGNGPAWDCVITHIPYYVYLYRGDRAIVQENAAAIFRYLHYLTTRVDGQGLLHIGLGDWCPAGRGADDYVAPLAYTDTVTAMDICDKAAYLFEVLGLGLQRDFARAFHARLRAAVRGRLVDLATMTAVGDCQTSQAMGLYYGVFDTGEAPAAFARLLQQIERTGGHLDTGVLGGRVLFHVLSAFGRSDLALQMIARPDFPSYGNWVARGATTLWEMFLPEDRQPASLNHHFWGDISGWFIQCLAGIRYNPHRDDFDEVEIRPAFVPQLTHAAGFHIAPRGRIDVRWEREDGGVTLTVALPEGMHGQIGLESGWRFADGQAVRPAATGTYRILQDN